MTFLIGKGITCSHGYFVTVLTSYMAWLERDLVPIRGTPPTLEGRSMGAHIRARGYLVPLPMHKCIGPR